MWRFVVSVSFDLASKRGDNLILKADVLLVEPGQGGVNGVLLLSSPLDDISIVSASMKLIFLILVSRSGGICTH